MKNTGTLKVTTPTEREARDAVLKTPMEQGVAPGYERLAELLALPGLEG